MAGSGFVNHAIGVAMNTGMELANPNNSVGDALVRGAFWFGAEALIPGFSQLHMMGGLAKAGVELHMDHKRYGKGKIQKYYRPGFGGSYNDTQNAYTMRQRGVQAMQASKMNARSVLGSEARSFHTNF